VPIIDGGNGVRAASRKSQRSLAQTPIDRRVGRSVQAIGWRVVHWSVTQADCLLGPKGCTRNSLKRRSCLLQHLQHMAANAYKVGERACVWGAAGEGERGGRERTHVACTSLDSWREQSFLSSAVIHHVPHLNFHNIVRCLVLPRDVGHLIAPQQMGSRRTWRGQRMHAQKGCFCVVWLVWCVVPATAS